MPSEAAQDAQSERQGGGDRAEGELRQAGQGRLPRGRHLSGSRARLPELDAALDRLDRGDEEGRLFAALHAELRDGLSHTRKARVAVVVEDHDAVIGQRLLARPGTPRPSGSVRGSCR